MGRRGRVAWQSPSLPCHLSLPNEAEGGTLAWASFKSPVPPESTPLPAVYKLRARGQAGSSRHENPIQVLLARFSFE